MDQLDREESVGANTDFKTAGSNTGATGILREEIAASDCKYPLEFERLTLWPPVPHQVRLSNSSERGAVLCRALSGRLCAGDSLLIVGPSGCGKSSLLRAVAGLWRTGTGTIRVLPRSTTSFLPQEPYLPLDGSLRQQLCFPHAAGDEVAGDQTLLSVVSDFRVVLVAKHSILCVDKTMLVC